MRYVPPIVMEELESIMKEDGIDVGSVAFRKMVDYSRRGRERRKKGLRLGDVLGDL